MFRTRVSIHVMASRLFAALAIGLALSFASLSAAAKDFNRLVVFGDSLSDNGNLYRLSGETFPPFPYYQGRFSNGPVWVEDLAANMRVALDDHAVGGAFTDTRNYNDDVVPFVPGAPGMQTILDDYLATHHRVEPKALYVIWGGANDYLNGQVNPFVPVGNLVGEILALSARGAKSFLIPNLPDLGSLPGTLNSPFSAGLNQLTAAHNAILAASIQQLQAALPDRTFITLDFNSLVRTVRADPAPYGFTNVSDRALWVFPGTAGYLFWDDVHPTAAGHEQLANFAFAAIGSNGHGAEDGDDSDD